MREHEIVIESENDVKMSWADTYRAMAQSDEDWSDWTELDIEDSD